MADKWNLDGVSVTQADVCVFKTFTVATLPTAVAGGFIFVSNGAAGSPVMAFGDTDGGDWLRVDTKAAVAAS